MSSMINQQEKKTITAMQLLGDNQVLHPCQVGEIVCCIWSKDSSPYLDPSLSLS